MTIRGSDSTPPRATPDSHRPVSGRASTAASSSPTVEALDGSPCSAGRPSTDSSSPGPRAMMPIGLGRSEGAREAMGHGRRQDERTAYPGVRRIDARTYRVRGEWRCPKTGRTREIDRIVTAASAEHAATIRAELRSEMVAGAEPGRRLRLDDFATSWLEGKRARTKASTQSHYAAILDLYISPALGAYYLDAITREDVTRWLAAQRGTPQTVGGRLRVLRMLLADAAAEYGLPNPAARVPAPRVVRDEDEHRVIPPADLARLLAWLEAESSYHAIALVLALTGMRYGEAAALRWSDIDERAGTIRISRRFYRGEIDTPKNGRARTVPLPEELAAVLRARRAELVRTQAPGLAEGWVFAGQTGGPVRQVGFAAALARASVALELPKRVTPHWFRHSFNDLLRRAASGEVQRAIVGHSSVAMAEHYSHVTIDEKRRASAAAVALLRAESKGDRE